MMIGVVILDNARASFIQARCTGPSEPRDQQAAQHQEAADRPQHLGNDLVPSPPRYRAEHQERGADDESEPPALGRAQSSWNSCFQFSVSFHVGWASFWSRNGPSTRQSMWVRMKQR